MMDVDEIIRDSKAATANLMEIIRYFEFINWVKIPATLLMTMDTIYFHGNHFLYINFGSSIVFSIFMAMSSPSKNSTRLIPNGNALSLINHLRFWGSVIITTSGFVAVMFYFRGTKDFVPNPKPYVDVKWYPYTSISSVNLLMLLPIYIFYPFFIYISKPWKQKIYRNIILITLIVLNVIAAVIIYYLAPNGIPALAISPISVDTVSIILLIGCASCFLGFVYHQILT